jgi:cytochrome c-type biogenesis protein CcmH/NrfG
MPTRNAPDSRDVAQFERRLLAGLGLDAGASNEQLEFAHDEVVRYVEAAPTALRAWSRQQLAAIDEAYALLSGPRGDLIEAAAAANATALVAAQTATTPSAVRSPAAGKVNAASPAAAPRGGLLGAIRSIPRIVVAAVGVVAVGAVIVVVYNIGAPAAAGVATGTPAPQASAAAPAVDAAQVSALMQKLAANPNDVATLQALGDLYWAAKDYETARTWMEKVVALEPANVAALLALGAAQFNTGDQASAEANWRKVLTLDTKNAEAHYDLGFMYFTQNPPDVAKVKAEWNQFVALSPDSELVKYVTAHLASLEGSPAPSAAASGAASATAAPASPAPATPAPSASN